MTLPPAPPPRRPSLAPAGRYGTREDELAVLSAALSAHYAAEGREVPLARLDTHLTGPVQAPQPCLPPHRS